MIKNFTRMGCFSKPQHLMILLPLTLLLYGCPYSSVYKLDAEAGIDTDKSLMGKWATMVTTKKGMEPLKLILSEKNDKEYNVALISYVDDLKPYNITASDTLKGSAFISVVANRQFFNMDIRGQIYISEIIYQDNKLSILPLAECFTAKYIKSGEELRTAVEFHIKTRVSPTYDETFSLKDMVRVN